MTFLGKDQEMSLSTRRKNIHNYILERFAKYNGNDQCISSGLIVFVRDNEPEFQDMFVHGFSNYWEFSQHQMDYLKNLNEYGIGQLESLITLLSTCINIHVSGEGYTTKCCGFYVDRDNEVILVV